MSKTNGQCLCGAVRFEATVPVWESSPCHCKMCRRWGGGLPLATMQADISLQQSDALRWWKSSPWGERGFCGECGSSLFWRVPSEGLWGVSVGALDDQSEVRITAHIFADDNPGFYDFTGDAPRQTGAQHTAAVLSQLKAQHGGDFLIGALAQLRAHSGDAFADEVARLVDGS